MDVLPFLTSHNRWLTLPKSTQILTIFSPQFLNGHADRYNLGNVAAPTLLQLVPVLEVGFDNVVDAVKELLFLEKLTSLQKYLVHSAHVVLTIEKRQN